MVKKLTCLFLIMVFVLTIGTSVFAATVGQQLTSPEEGWRRYDNKDTKINYIGNWNKTFSSDSRFYCDGEYWGLDSTASFNFLFYGSKLRFIAYSDAAGSRSTNIEITIDGNIYNASMPTSNIIQCLYFE
ncbi:MAG TPA: hypothetical protein VHT96_05575, partial [Clostridia bacterium]|nr:hypothetical protein [Clostridia bacterium]